MMSTMSNPLPQYSTLFTSGLLAPPVSRESFDRNRTPSPGPSARDDRSPTPTPARPGLLSATTPTQQSSTSTSSDRPRLRKRKSSLSLSVGAIPTFPPIRMSASLARARAGSISSEASAPTTMTTTSGMSTPSGPMRRLRSGSLGGALKAGARRLVRKAPTAPPNAPLPPLPPHVAGGVQKLLSPREGSASYLASPLSAPPTRTTFPESARNPVDRDVRVSEH